MPNWAMTTMEIKNADQNKLKEFDGLLDKWTSKVQKPNDWDKAWLGNIVLASGIGTVDTGADTDLRCRGSIDDYGLEDGCIWINTTTAWGPMFDMWVILVNKYLPGSTITYRSDIEGDAHITNDDDLYGKYILDSWDLSDDEIRAIEPSLSSWEIDVSETVIRHFVVRLLGKCNPFVSKFHHLMSIGRILEMFEMSEYAEKLSIKMWEYEEIGGLV